MPQASEIDESKYISRIDESGIVEFDFISNDHKDLRGEIERALSSHQKKSENQNDKKSFLKASPKSQQNFKERNRTIVENKKNFFNVAKAH